MSKKMLAIVIASVMVAGGAAAVVFGFGGHSERETMYNAPSDCKVSVSYDSGDGEVSEIRVEGRNLKGILEDGMNRMGHSIAFSGDGTIDTVDGKKADEGRTWAIWKWDTDWKVIPSIYSKNEEIDLKERSAFGISMAARFTTNNQGYTNPGYFVDVKVPGSENAVRVFSTTPRTVFSEAMQKAGHSVSSAGGGLSVDGQPVTDENGYAFLFQRTEFKAVKDPVTGYYQHELVEAKSWEKISLGDDKFFMRDRSNFAIVPMSGGVYEEPSEFMVNKDRYEPEGDFYFFIQVQEKFADQIDFEKDARGITKEDLLNGIWIKTTASTSERALLKIFNAKGWDLVLSWAIIGGNDLRGWIFYFYGLYSNGIYHSEDQTWDYPIQFNWNFTNEEWEFNQWTLGYYSYVSNPYIAIIFGNAPNNCNWMGDPDLVPEDSSNLWAVV